MKRLVIVLALVCILTCSCTPDTPPAESSAESSTEAATTEATTVATTEAVTPFEPTYTNVIWGEGDDPDTILPAKNTVTINYGEMSGRIRISEALEELIESAQPDDRIAVQYFSFGRSEPAVLVRPRTKSAQEQSPYPEGYMDPFINLPEDYVEEYVSVLGAVSVCFMTPDEISKLVVNNDTLVMISSISYDEYVNQKAIAN